jgi:uncharacterized phage protein (TIGR01671 family)
MIAIKFRVFDKISKQMYRWSQIASISLVDFEFEHYYLTQFTGLKDKNGKEIYIGDILATSNSDETYDIWNKETYGYSVVEADKESLGFNFTNWSVDNEEDFDKSVYSLMFVEVVGNIFENPELI